jgi:hypothetical protein
MLTPEQLEAAARKLCEIRGIDADLKHFFTEADVDAGGALHLTERAVAEWECKAEEIRSYLEIQQAIQSIPQPSPRIALHAKGYPLTSAIDASQSLNRCPDCGHEWRYYEIDKGLCVGSVDYCSCRNKQPRI